MPLIYQGHFGFDKYGWIFRHSFTKKSLALKKGSIFIPFSL
jgi:hypothetical protein